MAEVWGAAVAGSLIAGGASVYAGRQGAQAAQRGTDASIAEQGRQYDQTRADFAPQRMLGEGATGLLSRLFGVPGTTTAQYQANQDRLIGDRYLPSDARLVSTDGGRDRYYDVFLGDQRLGSVRPGGSNGRFTPAEGVDVEQLMRQRQLNGTAPGSQAPGAPTGTPDMSAFFTSPDYQFNLQQGQQAVDRSLAARGRALSGAGVKEGQRFASGLASGEYGNYVNRLFTAAGLGNAATQSTAAAGANMANNNSMALMNNANTRASLYGQTAAGVNNAVQGGIQNWMLQRYLTQQPVK